MMEKVAYAAFSKKTARELHLDFFPNGRRLSCEKVISEVHAPGNDRSKPPFASAGAKLCEAFLISLSLRPFHGSGQQKTPGPRPRRSSIKITTPHSSYANGGLPVADIVQWTLPRTFLRYRSDMGNLSLGQRSFSGTLPIHEIAGHADVCSGLLSCGSLNEMRFVFGKLPEILPCLVKSSDPNDAGIQVFCGSLSLPAHWTHSLPVSTMYNVAYLLSRSIG